MIRNSAWLLSACVAWCAACSCNDKEPPPPPITYQPAPSPESDAPERAPTAAEVPVAEDFDEESEGQINADNFRGELDRLEAEIGADNTP